MPTEPPGPGRARAGLPAGRGSGWARVLGGARPRLVATDLDGTLLRTDGTVSERTARALSRVAADGVDTVLVTARPPRWVDHLEHVVGTHGVALCANGAFVYAVAERRVLLERTIDPTVLAEVADDLRRALPGTVLGVEGASGLAVEEGFARLHPLPPGIRRCGVVEDLDGAAGKILVRRGAESGEDFVTAVTEVVADRLTVAYSGAVGMAEMTAPGVTKAAALADWAGRRGVGPEHVWAFGDMPNDLPMLEWAGTGFAMANGHDVVRAAADHTCPTNDEDGVAQVLEALLDLG